jgi:3-dehydroquinate dehydratase II
MKRVLIINGPNLNMLGSRENDVYGSRTFDQIFMDLDNFANVHDIELSYFQSNVEGEIINKIHESQGCIDYFIINPGALTHYSYSLHDALKSVNIAAIEVHMSNIFSREQWRSNSVISPVAEGVISGFGEKVYSLALFYISGL